MGIIILPATLLYVILWVTISSTLSKYVSQKDYKTVFFGLIISIIGLVIFVNKGENYWFDFYIEYILFLGIFPSFVSVLFGFIPSYKTKYIGDLIQIAVFFGFILGLLSIFGINPILDGINFHN